MAKRYNFPLTAVTADIEKVVRAVIDNSENSRTGRREFKVIDPTMGIGHDEVRTNTLSRLNGRKYEVLYNKDRKDPKFKRIGAGEDIATIQQDPSDPNVTLVDWHDYNPNKPAYRRLEGILESTS